jgi:hypothetical protein
MEAGRTALWYGVATLTRRSRPKRRRDCPLRSTKPTWSLLLRRLTVSTGCLRFRGRRKISGHEPDIGEFYP